MKEIEYLRLVNSVRNAAIRYCRNTNNAEEEARIYETDRSSGVGERLAAARRAGLLD